MADYLTIKEWDEASTEQRSIWLAQGRLVSPSEAIALRGRQIRARESSVVPLKRGEE